MSDPHSTDDRWLDSREAAAVLGCGLESLYQKVHFGRIRAYKLVGRLKFKRSDLDAAYTLKVVKAAK